MTLNCSRFFAFHTMTSSFDHDMALKEAMQDQQFIDSDILDDLHEAIRETSPEDWTPEEVNEIIEHEVRCLRGE
jgi:hypothetical protein